MVDGESESKSFNCIKVVYEYITVSQETLIQIALLLNVEVTELILMPAK